MNRGRVKHAFTGPRKKPVRAFWWELNFSPAERKPNLKWALAPGVGSSAKARVITVETFPGR